MQKHMSSRARPFCYGTLAGLIALALTACGGSDGGNDNTSKNSGGGGAPIVQSQTLTFQAMSSALLLNGTATVSASASSGLPVSYSSSTGSICTVDGNSGLVTALRQGNCIIVADQAGNAVYAAVQESLTIPVEVSDTDQKIVFSPVSNLVIHGKTTVVASIGSNQPLQYASLTPDTCASDAKGVVEALASGDCSILAKAVQSGSASNRAAQAAAAEDLPKAADSSTEAVLTFPVTVPENTTVPGAPANIKASAGAAPNTVEIVVGEIDSGGLPVTYHVTSSLVGTVAATREPGKPIVVDCQTSCRGQAFSVSPANSKGYGAQSESVDVITAYSIVETFREPDTQPNDTIFTGSFDFNLTTGTVSNLAGDITQSMTHDSAWNWIQPMETQPLAHQLKSEAVTLDGVDGLLVTTFKNDSTSTFKLISGSDDDWSPLAGIAAGGVFYGYPGAKNNPGNAYAMVFINLADPTAPLTQGQIDKLAYADCTPVSMMGSACMTGTSKAGYGQAGTMNGYPVSQVVTKQQ